MVTPGTANGGPSVIDRSVGSMKNDFAHREAAGTAPAPGAVAATVSACMSPASRLSDGTPAYDRDSEVVETSASRTPSGFRLVKYDVVSDASSPFKPTIRRVL